MIYQILWCLFVIAHAILVSFDDDYTDTTAATVFTGILFVGIILQIIG